MSSAGAPLSPRERQIAGGFAGGATYQQLTDCLNLAPSTVRTHLATICRKLGVSTKLDLRRQIETAPAADPPAELPPRPDKPSIAVLAFENMSDNPGQDYVSDAITADIITALSRSPYASANTLLERAIAIDPERAEASMVLSLIKHHSAILGFAM